MGRNKIKIEKIQNERNRIVTFIKRKKGLFKKAMELSLLCEAQVFIAVISKENQLSIVTTTETPETFIEKNLQYPLQTNELYTIKDYSSLYISKDEVKLLSQPKEMSTTSNSKQTEPLTQKDNNGIPLIHSTQKEIISPSLANHSIYQTSFLPSINSYVYSNSFPYNQQFITSVQNTSEDKNNNTITNNNLMTTYIHNMQNNYYYLSQQQQNNNLASLLNINTPLLKNKRIRYENNSAINSFCVNKGNVTNVYNNFLDN